MESNNNYEEESTNSSEEVVVDQDLGVGRSYECVFCKRGFNTAQALGGHMNIHRKDRARNNKPKQLQLQQPCPRFYHQIIPSSTTTQSPTHHFSPPDHHQPILSYATYFPEYSTTTSSNIPLYGSSHDYHLQNDVLDVNHDQQASDPLEWRMSLSLEFPDLENKRQLAMNQEKDLDLELRLGYH